MFFTEFHKDFNKKNEQFYWVSLGSTKFDQYCLNLAVILLGFTRPCNFFFIPRRIEW